MMPRQLLTSRARQDLDDIWDWVAAGNIHAADRIVDAISELVQRLTRYKRFGRPYDAHVPGIQRFPLRHYPYVVCFRGAGAQLLVV